MKPQILIVFFCFLLIGLIGCESNNKVSSLEQKNITGKALDIEVNDREYFVLYTSFEEKKSSLFSFKNENQKDKIDIDDGALENMVLYHNKILLNSRFSGNYYEISKEGNVAKKSLPSKRQMTNSFYTPDGVILITNGGLSKKEGKIIYKSGLYGTNQNLSEKKYEKGFFTAGEYFQNHFYILNFDPSVEKEQLLKIDKNGNIIKTIDLGTEPNHSTKSMSVIGNLLYIVSNDGKVVTIDKNETVKSEELPIKGEIAQVLKKDDKLYVLYYSGDILLYSENGVVDTFKLQVEKDDSLIFIKAKFSKDLLHILYVYDRTNYKSSFKYDGIIYSYDAKSGNKIDGLPLSKITGMRLHDFELKN